MRIRETSFVLIVLMCGACSGDMRENAIDTEGIPTNAMARVSEEVFRFGTVSAGETVTHGFTFTNDGQVPVRIMGFQASCSCTVPEIPRGAIAPGDSVKIPASLKTSGKAGALEQSFTCTLDTGIALSFRFEGFVSPKTLKPVSFGIVNRGTEKSLNIAVPRYPGQPWEVLSTNFDEDLFRIESKSRSNAEDTYTLTLNDDLPYGDLSSEIVFETNDPLNPKKTVAVDGYVRFPVEAEPVEVTLGVFEAGQGASGVFEVYSPYEQAVTIEKIEMTRGESLEWDVNQMSPFKYEVTVKVGERAQSEPLISASLLITAMVGDEKFSRTVNVYGLSSGALPKLP